MFLFLLISKLYYFAYFFTGWRACCALRWMPGMQQLYLARTAKRQYVFALWRAKIWREGNLNALANSIYLILPIYAYREDLANQFYIFQSRNVSRLWCGTRKPFARQFITRCTETNLLQTFLSTYMTLLRGRRWWVTAPRKKDLNELDSIFASMAFRPSRTRLVSCSRTSLTVCLTLYNCHFFYPRDYRWCQASLWYFPCRRGYAIRWTTF